MYDIFLDILAEIVAGTFLQKLDAVRLKAFKNFSLEQNQFILYALVRKYKEKANEILESFKILGEEYFSFSLDEVSFSDSKDVSEAVISKAAAEAAASRAVSETPVESFITTPPSNTNIKYKSIKSALHFAVEKKATAETLRILVKNGVPIDYQTNIVMRQNSNFIEYDKEGERLTALEYAIELKNETLMDILIELGADVNKFSVKPALVRACLSGKPSMVLKLAQAGANLNTIFEIASEPMFPETKAVHNPLNYLLSPFIAEKNNFTEVLASLLSYGYPAVDLAHPVQFRGYRSTIDEFKPKPLELVQYKNEQLVQYTKEQLVKHPFLANYKLLVEHAIARVISNRIVGIQQLFIRNTPISINDLIRLLLEYVGVDEELEKFAKAEPKVNLMVITDKTDSNNTYDKIMLNMNNTIHAGTALPTTVNLESITATMPNPTYITRITGSNAEPTTIDTKIQAEDSPGLPKSGTSSNSSLNKETLEILPSSTYMLSATLPNTTATMSNTTTTMPNMMNPATQDQSKSAKISDNPSLRFIKETFQALIYAKEEREKTLLAESAEEWDLKARGEEQEKTTFDSKANPVKKLKPIWRMPLYNVVINPVVNVTTNTVININAAADAAASKTSTTATKQSSYKF